MPPPRKRPRACTAPPSPDQNETTPPPQPPPPPEEEDGDPPALTTTLPADLLPEIAARSDITTLVRFAACCKPLRRDILRPAFIRRVCREPGPGGGAAVVPPFVLGFLHAYDRASMKEEYPGDPRRGVLLRGAPRPVRGSHSRCLPSRRLRAPDLVPQRPRRAPPQDGTLVPQLRENMLKISFHGLEKTSFTSKITSHFCKALLRILVKMCENCIAILQSPQSA
ncbi:hypothetical protein HU200_044183 [Digitaria exilis]|uniref:F-box domain-containing protein n=1 Tax=Digitaria exilis TaxID=1010633 RepID=A0A835BD45_9POAL|nr:hypothetical protein HU200_044183 [Digitaria exilis]